MNAELTDSVPVEPEHPDAGSPRLLRVQKLSRVFRLICRLLMAFIVLVAIFGAIPSLQRLFVNEGSLTTVSIFFPAAVFIHGYFFLMAWLLERMFNAFADYGVFHPSGARYLKWLGLLFIVSGSIQLMLGLYVMVFEVFHVAMLGGFYGTIGTIILGAFTLMLGWVLEEACELREQQVFTI